MNDPPPDPALFELMEDMQAARQAVQTSLQHAPEDIQLHRIHGMYAGHILDIRKTLIQERSADKEQLLIDALKAVVQFLIAEGEDAAAQFIGDHLEAIGQKVKDTWQDSKASPDWPAATAKSVRSSPAPSPRSAKPGSAKKKTAGRARSKTSASSPKPISRIT